MNWKSFFAGLKFLTILPVPQRWCGAEDDLENSPRFYPLVGLTIGLLLAGMWWVAAGLFRSDLVGAVVIVAMTTIISGGLHLDGMADTADGFLSSRPREKILEIMKDSHIGTMGVAAIVFSVLFKVALWEHILSYNQHPLLCLILLAITGRCSFAPGMALLPYARESGLGRLFWKRSSLLSWTAAGVIFLTSVILLGWWGLAYAMAVMITMALFSQYCRGKIGGGTGDTLGAQLEIVECVALFMWSLQ